MLVRLVFAFFIESFVSINETRKKRKNAIKQTKRTILLLLPYFFLIKIQQNYWLVVAKIIFNFSNILLREKLLNTKTKFNLLN